MLSQTVEYALRAMVRLAQHPAEPQARHLLASTTQVPSDYLAKVMRQLARAGLVRAGRGPSGGFSLAKPGASISILDVVNAVDPIKRIETCPLGLETHRSTLCPLHSRMDAATAEVECAFRSTVLTELIGGRGVQPLCEVEGMR